MIRHRLWILVGASLALLALSLIVELVYEEIAELAVDRQHETERYGVRDFGEVTPRLFRGAQPNKQAWRQLQALGIDLVVNLRDEQDQIEAERQRVEALGMRYESIPSWALDRPDNGQVAEFLSLIRDDPEQKIFVHCRAGHDRTGVMVAAFRIALRGWTPERAIAEMERYHFDSDFDLHELYSFWRKHRSGLHRLSLRRTLRLGLSRFVGLHHLRRYIERFPEELQTDPRLRAFLQPAPDGAPKAKGPVAKASTPSG